MEANPPISFFLFSSQKNYLLGISMQLKNKHESTDKTVGVKISRNCVRAESDEIRRDVGRYLVLERVPVISNSLLSYLKRLYNNTRLRR